MLIHLLNVAMLTAGIIFASAIAIMDTRRGDADAGRTCHGGTDRAPILGCDQQG